MNSRPEVPFPRRPLYTLADGDTLGEAQLPAAVEAMAQAGVEWIQVRAKSIPSDRLHALLQEIERRLEGSASHLWLNDRVDLAALLPSAVLRGVHLGQDDLPIAAARKVLGPLWLGQSTHNLQQWTAAAANLEVDVLAVGPVFATTGKADPEPVVGLEGVTQARQAIDASPRPGRPLVAIGGIDADRMPRVLEAGADVVAVLGEACRGDIVRNCRRLLEAAA